MSLDKNVAALLDESAYTIQVMYPRWTGSTEKANGPQRYTFISNIQPRLQTGDTVIVTSENNNYPALAVMRAPKALSELNTDELNTATQVDVLQVGQMQAYATAIVVRVDKEVRIEPGDDIKYKWVVAKLDTAAYHELQVRNEAIHVKLAVAYKQNMRRSFSTQILAGLPASEQEELTKLLGSTK